MIFLAVTLGFFAENIREHITDAKKGKEYAIAYRDDLIKDTTILEIIISIVNRDIASCDSLNKYLQNGRTKEVADLQKIYQYNLTSLAGFSVNLTDRTSLQLKNSGGIGLLKNKKVINEILDYWNNGTILESMRAVIEIMRQQAR